MRIWFGTWNLEFEQPTQAQWDAFYNASGNHGCPISDCEVVAVALQEASRGLDCPPPDGFNLYYQVESKTRTKSQRNSQFLFIFVRNGLNHRFKVRGQAISKVAKWRTILPVTEYGKGSSTIGLSYLCPSGLHLNLAFSGVHFDSKDAAKRIQQISDLDTECNAIFPVNSPRRRVSGVECDCASCNGGPVSVHIVGGDFNYRIVENAGEAESKLIGDLIVRRNMVFARDTMVGSGSFSGWVLPTPIEGVHANGGLAGPAGGAVMHMTYKRRYDSSNSVAAVLAARNLSVSNFLDIYKIKSKNGIVQAGERAGELDLGWLDRVIYKTGMVRTNISSRMVNSTVLCSGNVLSNYVSDHSPVYYVFKFKSP